MVNTVTNPQDSQKNVKRVNIICHPQRNTNTCVFGYLVYKKFVELYSPVKNNKFENIIKEYKLSY